MNYEKKLKDDLMQEKNVRDERYLDIFLTIRLFCYFSYSLFRNKLQLQLQALISKYDQTMLEKYKEEIFLQEEYEKQKREFDHFLIEYKREDDIYEELVRKKEREARRLHEAKILLFTHTRAAKKIQRWWKKYLRAQRKLQKLKDKKGKKDKDQMGGKAAKPTGKGDNKKK